MRSLTYWATRVVGAMSGLVLVGALSSACTNGDPAVASAPHEESTTVTQTSTTTIPPRVPPSASVVPGSSGVSLPSSSTSQPSTENLAGDLQKIVDGVVAVYGGTASLAVSNGSAEFVGGADSALPAWSTIKVPIAIAALRHDPSWESAAAAAIESSDNAAAETLWNSVTPQQVEAVLAEAGAPIAVNTVTTRPEFSIYGQTLWVPSMQARFAAHLPCVDGAQPVLEMMGRIVPGQDYGIGQLDGARFKGGWGPDNSGKYEVRQFGRVPGPNGDVAIALTAAPADGTYATAQAMATQLAQGLTTITADLPPAACQ